MMYDAGFRMFCFGMENAADEILKKNHRPAFSYVEKICHVVKSTCDAFVKGYWIIGLPGENKETVKATKEKIMYLLKEGLMDLPCEHIFVPYPGSLTYDNPDKYGYKVFNKDWIFYDSRSNQFFR